MGTSPEATLSNEGDRVDDSFRQELSIMSSLQGHPNIAVLLGYVESDICRCLIMKIYAGGLSTLIADKSVQTLPVIDMSLQLYSGLKEMH